MAMKPRQQLLSNPLRAFQVLAAGNFPAARTIREIRRLHLAEFTACFLQVVGLARELGLVRLGKIAVNGAKA